jgi:hypothetical protein
LVKLKGKNGVVEYKQKTPLFSSTSTIAGWRFPDKAVLLMQQ